QLRTGQYGAVAETAGDEDLAVVQQRRRAKSPGGVHTAGDGPDAGRWVVQFRAGKEGAERATTAAGDEYLAIVQQRRRGTLAGGFQAAGVGPTTRRHGVAGGVRRAAQRDAAGAESGHRFAEDDGEMDRRLVGRINLCRGLINGHRWGNR